MAAALLFRESEAVSEAIAAGAREREESDDDKAGQSRKEGVSVIKREKGGEATMKMAITAMSVAPARRRTGKSPPPVCP